jgi:hypothetical protein
MDSNGINPTGLKIQKSGWDTEFLKPLPVGAKTDRPVRVDEMVVCSPKGEVLYEWQCVNASDRVSFLEFLSRKATQISEGLNLGDFDRLEMEADATRVVAQIKKDRGIFMSATKNPHRPGK